MKIAIVGTGISGLTCGYYLHQQHDITLFEANDYIGGHTATVDVRVGNEDYAIDTGFIVYNDRISKFYQNDERNWRGRYSDANEFQREKRWQRFGI